MSGWFRSRGHSSQQELEKGIEKLDAIIAKLEADRYSHAADIPVLHRAAVSRVAMLSTDKKDTPAMKELYLVCQRMVDDTDKKDIALSCEEYANKGKLVRHLKKKRNLLYMLKVSHEADTSTQHLFRHTETLEEDKSDVDELAGRVQQALEGSDTLKDVEQTLFRQWEDAVSDEKVKVEKKKKRKKVAPKKEEVAMETWHVLNWT